MNVGIFLGAVQTETGGGFTLVESIVTALETVETSHKIFVFYYGTFGRPAPPGQITYVSLSRCLRPQWLIKKLSRAISGKTRGMLQLAAESYGIDLMWFVSTHYSQVDIPYLCTVFDLEHRRHPFFPEVGAPEYWKATERRYQTMIPRAAYVISGTEAGKRQIVDFYRAEPERVRVVPFPVAPFALRQAKEVPANSGNKPAGGRPYLFYPAQFWPHKNHVALLHALKLLKTKYRIDLDLICCGSDKGNLAHVRDTARSLGLENQVHFLGFVPQEELHALYRDAFALVYPSLFGPDNLPPLEAFAIGCPVIAARVAGATEQFADAALLVDPLRDEDIAQAVVRLHEDGGFRRDLIARGKDRIPGLTAQCYVREVVALFDEFEYYRRCWGRKEAPGFKAP